MPTRIEISHSNGLVAVFAVAYALIAAELLDINRIPRTFVHRDYVTYEVVFVFALWLCTLGSLRLEAAFSQRSVTASLGYGLVSGVVGGIFATLGLLSISLIANGNKPVIGYLSSGQGIVDFAWAATVISFGWLIGIISGAARFLLAAGRSGWLIGFTLFCILVRITLVASHLIHHQPLW